MEGLSQKIYLELEEPTEEDNRSSWERIQDALREKFGRVIPSLEVLQMLYPCCEDSGWKRSSERWNIYSSALLTTFCI